MTEPHLQDESVATLRDVDAIVAFLVEVAGSDAAGG
jgi:hypothetical protein